MSKSVKHMTTRWVSVRQVNSKTSTLKSEDRQERVSFQMMRMMINTMTYTGATKEQNQGSSREASSKTHRTTGKTHAHRISSGAKPTNAAKPEKTPRITIMQKQGLPRMFGMILMTYLISSKEKAT